MLTLADEVVAAIPALIGKHSGGIPVPAVTSRLAAAETDVRRAFVRLGEEGRAVLVRDRAGYRLFPAGAVRTACVACRKPFVRMPGSKRRTCTRACAVALSWKDPEVARRRRASIAAEKLTPEARARTVEANLRRWARPGEREKLSARNRETWANPETAAKRAAGIRKSHRTPEKRAFYRDLRRKDFEDPEYRARHLASVRKAAGKPERRAKLSESLRERWKDPKKRKALLRAVRKTAGSADVRAKLSERTRKRWADPVEGKLMRARNAAPETNQRKSASLKKTWASPVGHRTRLAAARKVARTRTRSTRKRSR